MGTKTEFIKPMLACNKPISFEQAFARRPVWHVQAKLDGIRCNMRNRMLYTRTGNVLPNEHTQDLFAQMAAIVNHWDGGNVIDGELVLFDREGKPSPFHEIQSVLMAKNDFAGKQAKYFLFDCFDAVSYTERYARCQRFVSAFKMTAPVDLVPNWICYSPSEANRVHEQCIEMGYEGTILRDPHSHYKQGRATEREATLFKHVDWRREEAALHFCEELMINGDTTSTRKMNMKPGGTLGAMVVEHIEFGVFNIGSGFDDAQRAKYWADWREGRLTPGTPITFKYRPHHMKDKPQGIFVGIRYENTAGMVH